MKYKIIIYKMLDRDSYEKYDMFSMSKHLITYEIVGGEIVYKKYHEDSSGRISAKDTKALKSYNQTMGRSSCNRLRQMLFGDIVPDQKVKGAKGS